MEDNNIHQLLERYWQCETSLEEERLLQDFFSGDSIPEELKIYKSLFIWKDQQKTVHAALVRLVASKKPVMHYFYPVLKIAASVLVVLLFGIGIYTHYRQEQFMDQLFSDSPSEILDARKDSIDVVAKASLLLSLDQIEDSLLLASPKIHDEEKNEQ